MQKIINAILAAKNGSKVLLVVGAAQFALWRAVNMPDCVMVGGNLLNAETAADITAAAQLILAFCLCGQDAEVFIN